MAARSVSASTARDALRRSAPRVVFVGGVMLLALVVGAVAGNGLPPEFAEAQDAEAAEAAISSVLVALRNIIIGIGTGLAALAFTVGGVMYMTATGSPQQMESGKTAMKSAVIGLVIVFIGYIFIDFLHGTLTNATGEGGSTDTGSTDTGSTDPGSTDTGSTDPGSTDTGSTNPAPQGGVGLEE